MRTPALFFVGCCITICAAQMLAGDSQQPSQPQTQQQPQAPKTIHQLFLEDQQQIPGAANGLSRLSPEEYEKLLKDREAQVRTLLAAGELKTGDDFEEAAFIFQHGNDAEHCLFAHVLAMEAVVKGNLSARWIAAATLDRYLQSIKQRQVFGTQYPLDPNLAHPVANAQSAPFLSGRTLEPYDKQFLPDFVRLDFCVPTLAQQEQNVTMFNAGERPKTLKAPGCNR